MLCCCSLLICFVLHELILVLLAYLQFLATQIQYHVGLLKVDESNWSVDW